KIAQRVERIEQARLRVSPAEVRAQVRKDQRVGEAGDADAGRGGEAKHQHAAADGGAIQFFMHGSTLASHRTARKRNPRMPSMRDANARGRTNLPLRVCSNASCKDIDVTKSCCRARACGPATSRSSPTRSSRSARCPSFRSSPAR